MFPQIFSFAWLVLVALCPLSENRADQEPAPGRKQSPAAPDKKSPKTSPKNDLKASLPFPEGETIRYVWLTGGKNTGDLRFTWRRPEADPSGLELNANREIDGEGNRLFSTTKTTLRADLKPVALSQTLRSFKEPNLTGGRQTQAVFEGDTATLTFTELGQGATRTQQHTATGQYLIFEKHAFEHWVVLATLLPKRGSPSLRLFMPSQGKMFKIQFNRQEPKEGDEEGVSRWDFVDASFAGSLWVSDDGRLHRYKQGKTDIVLAQGKKKTD